MAGLLAQKHVPATTCVAAGLTLLLALAALSTGCRHPKPRTIPPTPPSAPTEPTAQPAPAGVVQGEQGIASWYGHPYHGRRTASGEIYNMYDYTAAHRTLPFATRVKVRNLETGKDVVVRINDRGPFVEGRIIDLSYAAAQAVRMPGTAFVRLEILGSSAPARTPGQGVFAVQVGAFRNRGNAGRLKAAIAHHFGPVYIQEFDRGDGLFYRVRVGQENSEEAARQLASTLRRANLATETFVVRMD